MKNTLKTALIAAVVAILVVVGFGLVGNQPENPTLGSGTRYQHGISADSTSPSAGQVRGTTLTITSSASTGALTATGDSSVAGTLTVKESASSTAFIGGADWTGCLALGDSSSPTSTNIVYITATGATLSATTTKPSICQ